MFYLNKEKSGPSPDFLRPVFLRQGNEAGTVICLPVLQGIHRHHLKHDRDR